MIRGTDSFRIPSSTSTVASSILPLFGMTPATSNPTQTETHWSATLEYTTLRSVPFPSANTSENQLPDYLIPLLGGLCALFLIILIAILGYCLVIFYFFIFNLTVWISENISNQNFFFESLQLQFLSCKHLKSKR